MVRGVKRIIRDEKQFRRVLATKNASRARALASASSSRSLARRKPFSRDGSISLRYSSLRIEKLALFRVNLVPNKH